MGSTACGEPSPTICLIERGAGIPRNSQCQRRVIAGSVGLGAETPIPYFLQDCLIFHRYRHLFNLPRTDSSTCQPVLHKTSVGLHGAPIKLSKRWGSLCIQRIALDRWKTCAVSGWRMPGEKWSTGWRKQRNGENSRNLPTPSSRGYPSSSTGARNPAITELKRCGALPLAG
jgi:hypothetical protein